MHAFLPQGFFVTEVAEFSLLPKLAVARSALRRSCRSCSRICRLASAWPGPRENLGGHAIWNAISVSRTPDVYYIRVLLLCNLGDGLATEMESVIDWFGQACSLEGLGAMGSGFKIGGYLKKSAWRDSLCHVSGREGKHLDCCLKIALPCRP